MVFLWLISDPSTLSSSRRLPFRVNIQGEPVWADRRAKSKHKLRTESKRLRRFWILFHFSQPPTRKEIFWELIYVTRAWDVTFITGENLWAMKKSPSLRVGFNLTPLPSAQTGGRLTEWINLFSAVGGERASSFLGSWDIPKCVIEKTRKSASISC